MAHRFLRSMQAWPRVLSPEKGYSTFEWVSLFAVTLGVIVGTIATIQIGLPEMGRLARGGFERQIAAWEEGSSPEVLYGSGRGPRVGSGEVGGVEPGGGIDPGRVLAGLVDAIKEWAAGRVEQIRRDWEGFKDWLGDAWEGFSSWVQGVWEAAPNWLKGLVIGASVALVILIVAIIIVGTGGIGLVVLLAMLGAVLGGLLYGWQAGDGPFNVLEALLYSGSGAFLLWTGGQSLLLLGSGFLTRVGLMAALRLGFGGSVVEVLVYGAEWFMGFREFSLIELGSRALAGFVTSVLLAGFLKKLIGSRLVTTQVGERIRVSVMSSARFSRGWWIQQGQMAAQRARIYLVENVRYIDRRYLVRVYTPVKTGVTLTIDLLKARLSGGEYGVTDAAFSVTKAVTTAPIDAQIGLHNLDQPEKSMIRGAINFVFRRIKDFIDWFSNLPSGTGIEEPSPLSHPTPVEQPTPEVSGPTSTSSGTPTPSALSPTPTSTPTPPLK